MAFGKARPRSPAESRPSGGESWLDALGFGETSALEGASTLDPRWGDEPGPGGGDDSRFLSRQARRLVTADDSAHRRVFRTYLTARATLGLALVLAQMAVDLFGQHGPSLLLGLCGAYALQAVFARLWSAGGEPAGLARRRWRWWATVGVDVAAFSAMHWLNPTATLNHAALLVLPVLMAGVLSPRVPALATAAAASLLLLGTAWERAMAGGDITLLLSQAGMAGVGLFVIVLVSGQMASRLAREERTARGSLELARQQAELNRLVIDEMSDGVLVVDHKGRVRAANPAARALLSDSGACPPAPFSLASQPGWGRLLDAVTGAYATGQWPAAGMDLTVAYTGETPRSVRVRARFTRGARLTGHGASEHADEVLGVLFLEELRTVLARQREERLAAMGRISAGIAHEIRNPLAAVSQANALLQEDALRTDQQRLVQIVADNVERLRRIVDDVMEAAPGSMAPSRTIDATAEVAAICAEWARTVGLALGSESRLRVRLPKVRPQVSASPAPPPEGDASTWGGPASTPEPLGAVFDPDHLRRVLVNLLENALRHASEQPGAVLVLLEPLDGPLVRLAVASDGEPIPPEVEAHLFEPFHSTRSRGTGLGLYICRELCERHGASIDYLRRPGDRHANLFQVVMRRDAIATEGRLHL